MTNRTFSYPLTLQIEPICFGTRSGSIWGNPNTILDKERASLGRWIRRPLRARRVQITLPPRSLAGVSALAPSCRSTVRLPFFVYWSDTFRWRRCPAATSNQSKPQFLARYNGPVGEPKPLRLHDHAGSARAGKLFLGFRALQGDVADLRSVGRVAAVTAPVAPPNVNLFAILAEPVNVFGGNTAHARVMLDNPAPLAGICSLSTDIQVNMPATTYRSCRKNRCNDF